MTYHDKQLKQSYLKAQRLAEAERLKAQLQQFQRDLAACLKANAEDRRWR